MLVTLSPHGHMTLSNTNLHFLRSGVKKSGDYNHQTWTAGILVGKTFRKHFSPGAGDVIATCLRQFDIYSYPVGTFPPSAFDAIATQSLDFDECLYLYFWTIFTFLY